MYKLIRQDDLVSVQFNDKEVMGGISPVITFESKTVVSPKLEEIVETSGQDKDGEYTNYQCIYKQEESPLKVYLIFRCYKEHIVCNVDALNPIQKIIIPDYFDPLEGVKLNVKRLGENNGVLTHYVSYVFWTKPGFHQDIANIDPHTISLLWQNGDAYTQLLPLCNNHYKCELMGNGTDFDIKLSSYSSAYNSCDAIAFILSSGEDVYKLSNQTASIALKKIGSTERLAKDREYPDFLEYIGWCTWDAFYFEVNHKDIMAKMDEFKAKKLPIKWVLIDDGWAQYKDEKLVSFKEDPAKFPEGMIGTTDKLKNEYGVDWVGVWQAFTGHWLGVHPESTLALEMSDSLYKTNNGSLVPSLEGANAFKFWNTWHRYLKKQGIDFVKVDNQSDYIQRIKGSADIVAGVGGVHDGLEGSVGINFQNRIINCMGMAQEDIFQRPVSAVSRNSDDFYPKKEGNFKTHAIQNAYNSYFHSSYFIGDWDMWWTDHESATQNAVLRAISGGPIYFSDAVGSTKAESVLPLILKDGKILRCDQNGMPTKDYILRSPFKENIPLKIFNTSKGKGLIATFNITEADVEVSGSISPSEIPSLADGNYCVYDYFAKKAVVCGYNDKIDFTMKANDTNIYVVAPIKNGFVSLGLTEKMVSPATIKAEYDMQNRHIIVLHQGGEFAFYSENAVEKVLVNSKETEFTCENNFYKVDCSNIDGEIIIEI